MQRDRPIVWLNTLLILAGIFLFVFLPARGIAGHEKAVITSLIALLIVHLVHLYHLNQLLKWVSPGQAKPLPKGRGAWGEVYEGLQRRIRLRVEQEKTLEAALDRFRRAIQALPDGLVIFNHNQQIDWINAVAEAHLQLNGLTDRGQGLTNLVRHPEFVSYLERRHYDEPLLLQDFRMKGQILLMQVIPYSERENLLLTRDISQQERLEHMRRDFVANVSHELKTPLTVVSGFAEMLADAEMPASSEQTQKYTRMIYEQAQRMQHLVEDLLALSSLESTQHSDHEENVDLAPMLTRIRQDVSLLSEGRHHIELDMQGWHTVFGTPEELQSAITNLASNAIRYTPAGGEVRLLWDGNAQGGTLKVVDTGIGIEPQHVPRLTERFYRVDRSRSRETGGTGLGLAIVKHVLNRHQARLEISSTPGEGSCFSVHFPAWRMRQEADSRAALN